MSGFRLGTTSYILPDDILPNVRYLARRVDDVELVLFEVDDGGSNLPVGEVVEELADLALRHDLTYTVHLPLDLRLGASGGEQHRSLRKARAVIERTRSLDPWAYVLHLDGKEVRDYAAWLDQAAGALRLAADWAGGAERLAVENLEGYPLDFIDPVLARVPAGRCIDIGHLWLEGHDPLPFIQRHLPRTRVVHLHGVGSRDHQSLAQVESPELRRVLAALEAGGFDGVLTLEVFGLEDFERSMAALGALGVGSWAG
jgi:sugar phosphate isomerase/epimerase